MANVARDIDLRRRWEGVVANALGAIASSAAAAALEPPAPASSFSGPTPRCPSDAKLGLVDIHHSPISGCRRRACCWPVRPGSCSKKWPLELLVSVVLELPLVSARRRAVREPSESRFHPDGIGLAAAIAHRACFECSAGVKFFPALMTSIGVGTMGEEMRTFAGTIRADFHVLRPSPCHHSSRRQGYRPGIRLAISRHDWDPRWKSAEHWLAAFSPALLLDRGSLQSQLSPCCR